MTRDENGGFAVDGVLVYRGLVLERNWTELWLITAKASPSTKRNFTGNPLQIFGRHLLAAEARFRPTQAAGPRSGQTGYLPSRDSQPANRSRLAAVVPKLQRWLLVG